MQSRRDFWEGETIFSSVGGGTKLLRFVRSISSSRFGAHTRRTILEGFRTEGNRQPTTTTKRNRARSRRHRNWLIKLLRNHSNSFRASCLFIHGVLTGEYVCSRHRSSGCRLEPQLHTPRRQGFSSGVPHRSHRAMWLTGQKSFGDTQNTAEHYTQNREQHHKVIRNGTEEEDMNKNTPRPRTGRRRRRWFPRRHPELITNHCCRVLHGRDRKEDDERR